MRLTVKQLKNRDPGSGMAVIDWEALSELGGLEDGVVVTTTNRPDLIDDALLRPGRLDRHVEVADPDEEVRLSGGGDHRRPRARP